MLTDHLYPVYLSPGIRHVVSPTLFFLKVTIDIQGLLNFRIESLQMVTAAIKLKDTPWKESYDQPR